MTDYLVSVVLGIVEGLTEFLPVSSTAHLRLTEAFLHIPLTDPFWKMYTIVIQLGAILALLLLFTGRILEFIRTFPHGEKGDRQLFNHPITLTFVAFVVTSALSLPLIKLIGKNLENIQVMAVALLIGGTIMWVVDALSVRRVPTTQHVEEMTFPQALWIGFCQTFSAVFPGVSRSMSTIAGGQIAGMSRTTALEFSFLLSIPTMIAATGYSLLKVFHPGKHADPADALVPLVMNTHHWIILAIGLLVSFIVALGVVEWFLQWVRRHGFVIFAVYRIVLGTILLIFGSRVFKHMGM